MNLVYFTNSSIFTDYNTIKIFVISVFIFFVSIIHHNVFRRWFDARGNERNSGSFVTENTYTVYHDQIFGYKQKGKWRSLPDFCFVEPVKQDSKWSVLSEKELVGELVYSNDYLKSLGMSVGDVIGFTPGSEYEFNIDGEKLYRMYDHQITLKL